jgi:hypothetical protein
LHVLWLWYWLLNTGSCSFSCSWACVRRANGKRPSHHAKRQEHNSDAQHIWEFNKPLTQAQGIPSLVA